MSSSAGAVRHFLTLAKLTFRFQTQSQNPADLPGEPAGPVVNFFFVPLGDSCVVDGLFSVLSLYWIQKQNRWTTKQAILITSKAESHKPKKRSSGGGRVLRPLHSREFRPPRAKLRLLEFGLLQANIVDPCTLATSDWMQNSNSDRWGRWRWFLLGHSSSVGGVALLVWFIEAGFGEYRPKVFKGAWMTPTTILTLCELAWTSKEGHLSKIALWKISEICMCFRKNTYIILAKNVENGKHAKRLGVWFLAPNWCPFSHLTFLVRMQSIHVIKTCHFQSSSHWYAQVLGDVFQWRCESSRIRAFFSNPALFMWIFAHLDPLVHNHLETLLAHHLHLRLKKENTEIDGVTILCSNPRGHIPCNSDMSAWEFISSVFQLQFREQRTHAQVTARTSLLNSVS